MIEIGDLTFRYGESAPLFDRFGWKAARGEAWSVLGSSGCGKTTLLHLLAGLKHPDSGSLLINGKPLERPRPETGLILQNHGLLPWATVAKNIELGFRIRRYYGPDGRHAPAAYRKDKSAEREKVRFWMEKMGIADLADRFPHQLSGGQQQRTAIARTMALEPDLLLMDEPFSSLDAPTRDKLCALMRDLEKEREFCRVLVTHSIDEALKMGDRLLVLRGPGREPVLMDNRDPGRREAAALRIRDILGEDYEE